MAAACGGAPGLPEVPDSFPRAALMTLASDSGGAHIELRSAPEPLVRGQNVGQLTVVDLPAALFLVAIGVFGCVFSAKQYERFYVCMERARQYRGALEEAVPESRILELKRTADTLAARRFPRLHSWRLGLFWVALHVVIATFGVLLAIMSIVGIG